MQLLAGQRCGKNKSELYLKLNTKTKGAWHKNSQEGDERQSSNKTAIQQIAKKKCKYPKHTNWENIRQEREQT